MSGQLWIDEQITIFLEYCIPIYLIRVNEIYLCYYFIDCAYYGADSLDLDYLVHTC
jgi:hypothetical protein